MVTMALPHSLRKHVFAFFFTILLSLLCPLSVFAADEHRAWVPPETETLHEELRTLRDSPLALAPLYDLDRLVRWMTFEQAERALEQARATVRYPMARIRADYMLLRLYLEGAAVHKAQDLEKHLGFIDHWRIVGPFRNDGMDGYDAVLDPEREGFTGEQQEFVGKFSDLRWLEVPRSSETGFIAADEYIGDASTAVIYAISECYFESTAHAAHLAVDGAYKLWVDEAPVASKDHSLGGAIARDVAPLQAKRGWHRIFLKVATDRVAPGWHLRIVDKHAHSVIRECRPPQDASPPVHQPDIFAESATVDQLLRDAQTATWTPEQRVNAAYILRYAQPDDPKEPWVEFLDGLDMEKLAPRDRVRASRAEHTQWKKKRYIDGEVPRSASIQDTLYIFALRSDQKSLRAKQDWVNGMRALLKRVPDDPRVHLQWLEMLAESSENVSVAGQLLQLLQEYGPRPALCTGVFYRAEQRDDDTEVLYDACAQRSLESIEAIDAYLARKVTRADVDVVQATLQALEPLWQGRVGWFSIIENVARSRDDNVAALHAIDQKIERRPHHADTYLRRAHTLLRLSRDEEAAVALRTALYLRPQERDARDLLSLIEVQGEKFYESWRIDDNTLRELAETLDAEQYHVGNVVNQRVVNVYRGGHASRYVQQAYLVQSREGAEGMQSFGVSFVPGQSEVQILAVQVLRPDGTRRESFRTRDIQPYLGPSDIYDYAHERRISLTDIQVGDIINFEYVKNDISQQNIFDDYFGELQFIDSYRPTALFRYVLYTDEDRDIFVERSGERLDLPSTRKDGVVERVYEEKDLSPVAFESYTPGYSEVQRYLHVSTYENVDKLANWYWNLIKDQLTTSPEMIATVHDLIRDTKDRREQVSRIYNYVVRNTRYVSLGFGIGGFRPHRTTSCFNQRYGDCKDTAVLLKVMLGIAGIQSHVVLIRTRDIGRLKNHLPSLAIFNHAITYVPEFELYLDGTASYNGSDELYDGDQGASSITVLDGHGGAAVETPFLPVEKNYSAVRFEVDARAQNVRGTSRLLWRGYRAAQLRQQLAGSDQRQELVEHMLVRWTPDVRVQDANYQGLQDLDAPVAIETQIHDGKWMVQRGDEYLVQPLGQDAFKWTGYAGLSERKHPVSLDPPSVDERTLILRVAPTFRPVQLPNPEQTVEHPDFGRFQMNVRWDDATHALHVHGTLTRHVTTVYPNSYKEFRAWVREIYRRANQPILFEEISSSEVSK